MTAGGCCFLEGLRCARMGGGEERMITWVGKCPEVGRVYITLPWLAGRWARWKGLEEK